MHTERFEDFAKNAFAVTISKVQQAALNKAGGRLPTPAEQLALVNQRRSAKKAREAKAKHSWFIIVEILPSTLDYVDGLLVRCSIPPQYFMLEYCIQLFDFQYDIFTVG